MCIKSWEMNRRWDYRSGFLSSWGQEHGRHGRAFRQWLRIRVLWWACLPTNVCHTLSTSLAINGSPISLSLMYLLWQMVILWGIKWDSLSPCRMSFQHWIVWTVNAIFFALGNPVMVGWMTKPTNSCEKCTCKEVNLMIGSTFKYAVTNVPQV